MRSHPVWVVALGLVLVAGTPAHARAANAAARAETLYDHAEGLLKRNQIDTRRVALRELEQATLLQPDDALYQLELARAYFACGFLKSAKQRFERVTRLAPADAEGRYGLALVWRRDWLKYLDRSSLSRAIENLSLAARLRPDYCDAWLMLPPLLVERGDDKSAARAAARALEADSSRPEALLACAYTAFRLGDVGRADSGFAAAVPRLRRTVRERYEDIAPVASERDTATLRRLPEGQRPEFVRRFWKDNDPDPVTPENEAQLEYWSRVTQAYFLFYDPHRRDWDERGELYVRYGPPDVAIYNPIGAVVMNSQIALLTSRANVQQFTTGPEYPVNVLSWVYLGLGMNIILQDRLLSERYQLPIAEDFDPDPVPDPVLVAHLADLGATSSGRAVFHRLPPGVRAMPVEGSIARFEGDARPRLLAQIEAPADPADSVWAEWVVLDSTRQEVARGGRSLAPSACDPTERRVADFAADVPPGNYLVGISVRDAHGRRGVFRDDVVVTAPPPALNLSDVVLSCGTPDMSAVVSGSVVRPAPNPGARVDGDQLSAYFEIYRLSPGAGGASRFEYVYTVRSAQRDPRIWIQRVFAPRPSIPDVSASRAEENIGPLRRQFLSVPIQALPAGPYRLEVKVRDLLSRDEIVRSADFTKTSPAAPSN